VPFFNANVFQPDNTAGVKTTWNSVTTTFAVPWWDWSGPGYGDHSWQSCNYWGVGGSNSPPSDPLSEALHSTDVTT